MKATLMYKLSYWGWGITLLAILGALSLWDLAVGTVDLPISQIVAVVYHKVLAYKGEASYDEVVYSIVWLLRLPRILLAIVVGSGLAIAGVAMQGIVKNPLADPYILGVSSGASLGATAAILLGVGAALGTEAIGIAAFIGAFAVSVLVLLIGNIGGRANAVKLLLAGMALSIMCSAVSSAIVFFSNDKEGTQALIFWLMGSLGGADWDILRFIAPIVLLACLFLWSQAGILNLFLVGDETAVTLGVELHKYRQGYLLVVSLIVGLLVYSAGMIGFVGLLVPHIVRLFWGTDHKRLIPLAGLCGAILTVAADALSRSLVSNLELPIGLLLSLVGAPVFVYLLIKRTYSFGNK